MGIDIVCGLVLVIAFLKGYSRGFIMAIFSVAALIVGAFATMHLSFLVSDYLTENFNVPGRLLPLIAFAITFSAAVLVVRSIGKLIEKGFKRILPTSFNRFMGSLLYGVLAIVLLSLVYQVAFSAGVFKDTLLETSFAVPHLEHINGFIEEQVGDVVPFVKGLFEEMNLYFEGLVK